MANDLKGLRTRLVSSKFARAKFLADTLTLLKDNGLDVEDDKVIEELHLDMDLKDGERFLDSIRASTVVITITK